jgi:hypothetical protein
MTVLVIIADGARDDRLRAAIAAGQLPELARLDAEGGTHTVASCFPSVTGPAYAPFIVGRNPAGIGLPALRWYDRARHVTRWPGYARSYVGHEMRLLDRDLAPDATTLFEAVGAEQGLASCSMLGRGLPWRRHVGKSLGMLARVTRIHFRGDLEAWMRFDRHVADEVARRVVRERPRYLLAALTGIDKATHAEGADSPHTHRAMRVVDDLVGTLRRDAERAGTWERTTLWVTSDHGHAPVTRHDDLADWARGRGHRVLAHPTLLVRDADVAVMVSGNAMAHLYVELAHRRRPFWPALAPRWQGFADELVARESVDLVLVPHSPTAALLRSARGDARLIRDGDRYAYHPESGDPLGLGGPLEGLDPSAAFDACAATPYPDALVQLMDVTGAARAGDLVLSATPGWDFRARFEPIPHVSTHGALHRDHMLVPWVMNRPPARRPRRTADLVPTALAALGLPIPAGLAGERVR